MNQTVSIMGNISLHTNAGTTVQPFLLEGSKFEFHHLEYAAASSEGNKESDAANAVKCKSEIGMETEKSNDNSPSTFQSNGSTVNLNAESNSPHAFTQSSSYSFQNYS